MVASENRFSSKGAFLVIGYITGFCYVYFVPQIAAAVWPSILDYLDSNGIEYWKFFFFGLIAWHLFLTISINLVMWAIYHIEHPFFEQYKINSNPWPWQENREQWIRNLCQTLKFQGFNSTVSVSALLYIDLYLRDFQVV